MESSVASLFFYFADSAKYLDTHLSPVVHDSFIGNYVLKI
jgi:hypothetical protein